MRYAFSFLCGCRFVFVLGATLLYLTGCGTSASGPKPSGFLNDYAELQPMPGRKQTLFYERSGVDWSQYTKVMVEPVTIQALKGDQQRDMSMRDRQMLARYFERTMRESVQTLFPVVDHPGPGVVVAKAAITNVQSSNSLISQMLNGLPGGFGQVSMEGELVDATTGQRLVAIVDGEAGTLFRSYLSWDDVTSAFDGWGRQLATVLSKRMKKAQTQVSAQQTLSSSTELENAENNPKEKEITASTEQSATVLDPWMGKPAVVEGSWEEQYVKPFVLGLQTTGDFKSIATATKKRLIKAGFEVVGEYAPVAGTQIIIVTDPKLKAHAAKSKYGGYGAVIRVSIATAGKEIHVAYTNPIFTNHIYRLQGNIIPIAKRIGYTMGRIRTFGANGMEAEKLRSWHYMFGMPRFDDPLELASSKGYQAAIAKVEAALAVGKAGVKQVYRVDIPGKEETLFGVAIGRGKGADASLLKAINRRSPSHVAHLPYEILVSGSSTMTLSGKFRIALSFPDLTMGEFMDIREAPAGIEKVLRSVAKGR